MTLKPTVLDRQVNDRASRAALLRTRLVDFARLPDGFAGDGTVPPSRDLIMLVDCLLSVWPKQLEFP